MASAAARSSLLYEVLGIPTSASGGEIKAAYCRLARRCRPDLVSVSRREMSADQFKKIHSAYSTLSDPDQRADYDRDLHSHRRRPSVSSLLNFDSAPAPGGRRNWETDQCWECFNFYMEYQVVHNYVL
ncbi:unnamed protein product [Linum tenue]|uniref:J domain-containing protein n=1 Tax=Linum tenue TaxID=586396 RepID=A0AAV0MFF1_9ROSI|nr:unnamed protein product [Linum tenue]